MTKRKRTPLLATLLGTAGAAGSTAVRHLAPIAGIAAAAGALAGVVAIPLDRYLKTKERVY